MIKYKQMVMPTLTGKNILITGANSGIGFEVAKHAAKQNANVFLCVRDTNKGEVAKQAIMNDYPKAKVVVMELDLSVLASVDAFVRAFKKYESAIDILINNAGIMAVPYAKTSDGFEMQIGVNHLGHFRLTLQLIPLMNNDARIVNVSSMAYLQGTVDQDNFMFEKGGYSPFKSYARSKLANVLFTLELAQRLRAKGSDIVVVCAHPGIAKTSLFDKLKQNSWVAKFVRLFERFVPSAYEGAKAIVVACYDPDAQSGNYYGPYKQRKYKGDVVRLEKVNDVAKNKENQMFLWNYSLEKTNSGFSL